MVITLIIGLLFFINICQRTFIQKQSSFQLWVFFQLYTIILRMNNRQSENDCKFQKGRIQKEKNVKHEEQEDQLNLNKKKKYSQKLNPWTYEQNKKYLIFISSKHIKQNLQINRNHQIQPKIIKQMTKYIGTRNYEQCYRHQTIMMNKYKSIKRIIQRESSIHKIFLDSEQIRKQILQLEKRTQTTFMIESFYYFYTKEDDKNLTLQKPINRQIVYIHYENQNDYRWLGQKQEKICLQSTNQIIQQSNQCKADKNKQQYQYIEINIPLQLSIKFQSGKKQMKNSIKQNKLQKNQYENKSQDENTVKKQNQSLDFISHQSQIVQQNLEKSYSTGNTKDFNNTKEKLKKKNPNQIKWTIYQKIKQLAFFNYNKAIMGENKAPKNRHIYVQMSMFIGTDKNSLNCKQRLIYTQKKYKASNQQLIKMYKKELNLMDQQLDYYTQVLDQFYYELKLNNRMRYTSKAPPNDIVKVHVFTPTYRVPQKDTKIIEINDNTFKIQAQLQVPFTFQFRKQIFCRF